MGHLKDIINKKSSSGKLAKLLEYAHRNSLNYRLNSPELITLDLFNKMSSALAVPRKQLIDAADQDIMEAEIAKAEAAKAKKKAPAKGK